MPASSFAGDSLLETKMPLQLRIAAIIAVALMTAAVHHRYVATQAEQKLFVAAGRPIKVGATPDRSDLKPIALGGDLEALEDSLVAWDDWILVARSPSQRDYMPGELFARRDVAMDVTRPYRPLEGEYAIVVKLPKIDELKSSFRIGSPVGFLIESKAAVDRSAAIQECGPFILRQIGPISQQLDSRVMQQIPSAVVTLSTAAAPGGKRPALAQQLLNAVGGVDGSQIIALYNPNEG
jgi:hypothetical protein